MTLTIAVPTIGRPTLVDTLTSITRQDLQPGDQVLVVYDSYQPDIANLEATRTLVEGFGFTFVAHDGGTHFYGNPQLNHAMTLATGDYFCALGDDDIYTDGAIRTLRRHLRPGKATLFQFYAPPFLVPHDPRRFVLWADRRLRVANISGCCLAAPRASLVPVKADPRIEVDFEWIVDIVAQAGRAVTWLEQVLIIARPPQGYHAGVATCPGCGETGFLEDQDADRLCGACSGVVLPQFLAVPA